MANGKYYQGFEFRSELGLLGPNSGLIGMSDSTLHEIDKQSDQFMGVSSLSIPGQETLGPAPYSIYSKRSANISDSYVATSSTSLDSNVAMSNQPSVSIGEASISVFEKVYKGIQIPLTILQEAEKSLRSQVSFNVKPNEDFMICVGKCTSPPQGSNVIKATFLSQLNENGNTLKRALTTEYDNTITITITDVITNKNVFGIAYRRLDDGKWIIDIPNYPVSLASSSHMDLFLLTASAWSFYIGLSFIIDKVKSQKKEGPKIQTFEKHCIDHDMVCTSTGGDRVLDLKVVQIDIYECCLQHDIDLWCSDSSSRPNNMAIMCVASKVVEKIINSPFPLNMLYWLALSPILMSFEILAHIVFEILGLGGVWKYPELGGGRGWSCLCGGDEQTYCCDPGRNPDLCYNKFGQLKPLCRDKCFNCYWTCMYDNFGNPLFDSRGRQVREQITDPSGKLHCCPGTPGDKYAKPCRV